MRAVLAADGLDAEIEIEIDRVVRVDVEGDGVDEVVIEAIGSWARRSLVSNSGTT